MKIEIKKEFKERLWSLQEDEYAKLKSDIELNGCREPLIIWNNILVDGHNRYEICNKLNKEYTTIQMNFESDDEVLLWIDKNQLSRRNLLDWQRHITEGRISKANKQEKGGDRKSIGQNVPLISQQSKAKELGISPKTLQRSEKFVDTYDTITKEYDKETANKLAQELTKGDMESIAKETPSKQIEIIDEIVKGSKSVKEARKKIQIQSRKETSTKTIDNSFELNKLFKGDSVAILKTFPDNIVDCVVMDPPYGIDYKDTRESYNPKFKDGLDESIKLLDETCKELKRICKTNAHIYCFFGMSNYIPFFQTIQKHFPTIEPIPIIWNKNNHTMCNFDKRWALKYEPIFFISNGERNLNYSVSRNVLDFDIPTNKLHKTQKPLDLCEYLINDSTVEGEVILDPFMGSGTTPLAAKNNNRKYLGIELEEDIYNIATERVEPITEPVEKIDSFWDE